MRISASGGQRGPGAVIGEELSVDEALDRLTTPATDPVPDGIDHRPRRFSTTDVREPGLLDRLYERGGTRTSTSWPSRLAACPIGISGCNCPDPPSDDALHRGSVGRETAP